MFSTAFTLLHSSVFIHRHSSLCYSRSVAVTGRNHCCTFSTTCAFFCERQPHEQLRCGSATRCRDHYTNSHRSATINWALEVKGHKGSSVSVKHCSSELFQYYFCSHLLTGINVIKKNTVQTAINLNARFFSHRENTASCWIE